MEFFLGHSTSVSKGKYIKELEAGMDAILTEFETSLKETPIMWKKNSPDEDKNYQRIGNLAYFSSQESAPE